MELTIPPPPVSDLVVEATPEQVAAYRRDGFVAFDRITTDEELAWIEVIYDHLFDAKTGTFPGGYFDLNRPYDSEGEDLNPQVLSPEYAFGDLRKTTYVRNARRISAALLGIDAERLVHWGHMIRKPPRIGGETPWHQDEAYWDPDKHYDAIGAWMPLDPATVESGCLHFVPGSHLGPVYDHRHVGDDPRVHALWTDQADTSTGVPVPLAPGGATFHHPRTLHYAGPNTSEVQRRAWAVEHQLPPVKRDVPAHRPWVLEGQKAMEARPVMQAAAAGGDLD